jgi:hypothetical protein
MPSAQSALRATQEGSWLPQGELGMPGARPARSAPMSAVALGALVRITFACLPSSKTTYASTNVTACLLHSFFVQQPWLRNLEHRRPPLGIGQHNRPHLRPGQHLRTPGGKERRTARQLYLHSHPLRRNNRKILRRTSGSVFQRRLQPRRTPTCHLRRRTSYLWRRGELAAVRTTNRRAVPVVGAVKRIWPGAVVNCLARL